MPEDTGPLALLAAAGERTSAGLQRVLAGYMIGSAVFRVGKARWEKLRVDTSYSIAIPATEDIYPEVHRWLLEQIPPDQRRAVTARSHRIYRDPDSQTVVSSEDADVELLLFFDGTRSQQVRFNGHKVWVYLERPDLAKFFGEEDSTPMRSSMHQMERIVFVCRGQDAREAVLAFLEQLVHTQAARTPRLMVADRWSDWIRRPGSASRPLETVVLAGNQREELVEDLRQFLAQEADYARLGVPWHRGYLFHGPPGTGKTSIAKALAHHFRLDTYYIPLPAIPDDSTLVRLLTKLEARSVLLLEDVDCLAASQDRAEVVNPNNPGISLSGLLNALDGIVTPHGLITVMTTNDRGALDPALIRPGRVDRDEHFGYLDADQFGRLCETFTGMSPFVDAVPDVVDDRVTPAQVVEAMKRHLGDPPAMLGAAQLAARSRVLVS